MKSRGPLPDECISSWLDRELALHPRIERPTARHYHVNDGPMVHPDIRPRRLWLEQVAAIFAIDPEELRHATLWHRYPGIEAQYLRWARDPHHEYVFGGKRKDRTDVRIRWCTRCLSEDMRYGISGYVRRDWLLSIHTVCPKHAWPLEGNCSTCRRTSYSHGFRNSHWPGPYCEHCGFPLTRAQKPVLRAEPIGLTAWKALVQFERKVKEVVIRKPDRILARGKIARRKFLAAYCDLFELLYKVDYRRKGSLRGIDYFETLALPFYQMHVTQPSPICHPMLVAVSSLAMRISATIGALFDETDVLPRLFFQRSRAELLGHLSWFYGYEKSTVLWESRNRWPEKFLADLEAAPFEMALDMELRNPKGFFDAISNYKRTGQIA